MASFTHLFLKENVILIYIELILRLFQTVFLEFPFHHVTPKAGCCSGAVQFDAEGRNNLSKVCRRGGGP